MNSNGPNGDQQKKPKNKKKKNNGNNDHSINVPSGNNSNYSVKATTSIPKTPIPPNQNKKVNNKRAAKKKREMLLEASRKASSDTPLSITSDSSIARVMLNEINLSEESDGEFSSTSSCLNFGTDDYRELPTDALILNTETVDRIIEQISTDIESEDEDNSEDSDEFDDGEAMNSGCQRYFLENSGPKCFNCGESGHILKDCPSTSTVPCNLCGQIGHSRFNCPQEVCYNCSRPGHQSKACPAKRKRRVYDDDLCNRCGQPGHLARECSMSWRGYVFARDLPRSHSTFLEELRGLRKRCYNCASISHFGDDCPNRRRPNYSVFHIPDYDYLDRVILRIKSSGASSVKPQTNSNANVQAVKKEPNAKQKQADNFKKIVNPSPRKHEKSHKKIDHHEEDIEMHYNNSKHLEESHQNKNRKVFLQSRGINNSSDNEDVQDYNHQNERKISKPVSFVTYEANKVRVKDFNPEEDEKYNFKKGSSGNKNKLGGGSYRGGYKKK